LTDYYVNDYSLAGQPLIFSDVGKILNPDVRDIIKSALMANDCEVSIKQLIFDNMKKYQLEHDLQLPSIADIDKMPTPDFYKSAFSSLCSEINEQGGRINLDDVCLKGISISGCLDYLTAKRAVFKQVKFRHVQMKNADLTGAILDNSHFFAVNLRAALVTDVIYKNAKFEHTEVGDKLTDDTTLLRSGHWRRPKYAMPYFALDCTISTKTDRIKVSAFRLPVRPGPEMPPCSIM
jgi:hypothetical protein